MKHVTIDDILPLVQKPGRYIGGEVNAVVKDWDTCDLTFALAFPDTYEVGMSHLGMQILYSVLNQEQRIAAERVFAPWPDLERYMRLYNLPLTSLETRKPLSRFNMVGFSLQYELSYTNVLTMLDLGGIPLRSADRSNDVPIIVAGGPCTFNPEPMSIFFDAFVIGEGEKVVLEIVRSIIAGRQKGYQRKELITSLTDIEGLYVPTSYKSGTKIKKRTSPDINRESLPLKPIVPIISTIHDRITLEISRGCTRGCRFCQAGMVWRPVRERSVESLQQYAKQSLITTGHDEISLLSLSSGDYSCISSLLAALIQSHYEQRIAMALPSLRVETLTEELIGHIKKVRKTSFTLAPEAGTQRLRDVINKGNTEDDLLDTVRLVFKAGWRSIKLYFMLGLPTEAEDDLEGIVDLAYKVLKEGSNKRHVTVSLSTFVPKPHTPFQWERQINIGETLAKQAFFKHHIRHRNLSLKWHDSRMSLLEGVLSRGDSKIGNLIAHAYSLGCRFDGWSDKFQFDRWEKAIHDTGITPTDYTRKRETTEELPWNRIDCGLSSMFLIEERERAFRRKITKDCRSDTCHHCGVCDSSLTIKEAKEESLQESTLTETDSPTQHRSITKYRLCFTKQGNARLLSHLETSSALIRAINMSGLLFAFSEGFHPAPKISFALAMPVGIESMGEYADIQLQDTGIPVLDNLAAINSHLPSGIQISTIDKIGTSGNSLSASLKGFDYELHLPKTHNTDDLLYFHKQINSFLESNQFMIWKLKKGKGTERNIRPYVKSLQLTDNHILSMTTIFNAQGGIRPEEIVVHVLGLNEETAKIMRIIKTKTHFSDQV